jgi:hypothetical protein
VYELFGRVAERLNQRAKAASAKIKGAAQMPYRHMHDGALRPAVVALLAFARIEMNKHSSPLTAKIVPMDAFQDAAQTDKRMAAHLLTQKRIIVKSNGTRDD